MAYEDFSPAASVARDVKAHEAMGYTYTEEKGGIDPDTGKPHIIKYKVTPDGTSYHVDTPDRLVKILEGLRKNRTRIRIYFGDVKTGRDWEEDNDVFGTISRSYGGRIHIPILINNARSTGGGALLDHCIVKIEHASKKQGGVIYQVDNYHCGEYPLATRQSYLPRKKPGRKPRAASAGGLRGVR